ncbi:MAG: glycine oxidase ThiO [Gemmatimonadota bacterium]|nr:MAG: glycine oxidase ThiO [Gemmatimonadota bacterium]
MPHPDVLVVGGGIVGMSCARAMAVRGHQVVVVESGSKTGAASRIAAGMLAPQAESAAEDQMLELAVRARDLYVELAPALSEEVGIDIGLWTGGILQVAFTDEEVADRKHEVASQRQSGFTAEWLTPDEVLERAPGISQEIQGAAYAPEDGLVDPQALLEALRKSAEARGVKIIEGEEVTSVVAGASGIEGVETGSGKLAAGAVVLAAGAWSGRIGGLARPLSVEPIRGQIAVLDWPPDEPPAIVYGAGGYVVNRGQQAVVGSTMEHAGFDATVTDEGLSRIRQIASHIYPSLTGQEVRYSWAGLRPQTPDGRPFIGPDPNVAGLWYATGHGRNGILLAGYTGELLAQLFSDEPIEHDLCCIDPGRFWAW